mmetsp:Transcript_72348/g.150953  ORF Transcript_72348/g.150953 Transcript_72348/m.150953 type:complete len:102 (-) Transcript_72348:1788-2093(-)
MRRRLRTQLPVRLVLKHLKYVSPLICSQNDPRLLAPHLDNGRPILKQLQRSQELHQHTKQKSQGMHSGEKHPGQQQPLQPLKLQQLNRHEEGAPSGLLVQS